LDGVEKAWTSRPGEAVDIAAEAAGNDDFAMVAAVGGDGTMREVAEGLTERSGRALGGPALLALPAGSGNSTSRNVWGERTWQEIVDLAVDRTRSRVRQLDMMRLVEPNIAVLLGASSGFLAAVLVGAGAITEQTGLDRYYASAARVLDCMPSYHTRVCVDGAVVHDGAASLVVVGGGRFRAHAFQFLPYSLLDDGQLDVCIVGALAGPAANELAGLVVNGGHVARPDVTYRRGRRVSLERIDGRPLLAEYDGEVWSAASSACTVEVVPAAVAVLAPVDAPAG
jgi:diacylglycerol kinase (ATP)